jgi:hypothetical protein
VSVVDLRVSTSVDDFVSLLMRLFTRSIFSPHHSSLINLRSALHFWLCRLLLSRSLLTCVFLTVTFSSSCSMILLGYVFRSCCFALVSSLPRCSTCAFICSNLLWVLILVSVLSAAFYLLPYSSVCSLLYSAIESQSASKLFYCL